MYPCAAALSLSSFIRSYFRLVFMMEKKGEAPACLGKVVLAPPPEFDLARPMNHRRRGLAAGLCQVSLSHLWSSQPWPSPGGERVSWALGLGSAGGDMPAMHRGLPNACAQGAAVLQHLVQIEESF